MEDVTQILAEMVGAFYPPLSGNSISFDENPPGAEDTVPDPDIYAVVNVQDNERNYIIQGGGGRYIVDWTLRLVGTRAAVAAASRELPMLLNNPYRHIASESTVMWTHLMHAAGIGRIPQSVGNTSQIMRWESEVINV